MSIVVVTYTDKIIAAKILFGILDMVHSINWIKFKGYNICVVVSIGKSGGDKKN